MRSFKIEKGTTLLEFLQMQSWVSDISQNKIGYLIAANFNLITEDGQENLYWIEDEFSDLAPDQYEELKSKLNKMKNKEIVEGILNSYAKQIGHDNWTEMIGYCNNEPEEIAAHYEMAMDKYISEQKSGLDKTDKFAELKEAHRNGAKIQFKDNIGYWRDIDKPEPTWSREEYRIKPEEKKGDGRFIKGQWYTHTEPGQEKFLIRVEDPEKQICSGWDCKGNPFKNEWVHLGNRLKRIPNDVEHIDALNKLLEANFK